MATPTSADAVPYNDSERYRECVADFLLAGETGKQLHALVAGADASAAPPGLAAAASGTAASRRVPLVVHAMELFDALPEMYPLLSHWTTLKEILNDAAHRAAMKTGCQSSQLRVRLAHVPGAAFARASVSQLRVADVGRFVRFIGTLTRAGAVKVVQELRDFRCEQCGNTFRCRASPEAGYEFDVPKECQSGEKRSMWDSKKKRPKTVKCHSKAFLSLPCSEDCMSDFQEVRVQDQMHAVTAGVVPGSISVVLFGDLIGRIQPGDSVSVEGVVWQRWKPPWQGKRLEVELFIEATNVERLSSNSPVNAARVDSGSKADFDRFWVHHRNDEWQGRRQIINAIAPWLSGLPVPKLALLLTLIGGVPATVSSSGGVDDAKWEKYLVGSSTEKRQEHAQAESGAQPHGAGLTDAAGAESSGDKVHTRTTPHLLLLGDPGTGKSQLLQAAHELANRSVRTSGLGCSSAGLTCAAVRDGPDFVLEAGALVLADGGVCCIDEFSTIRSHDRAAVHEAMEQQTVSVAKAGLVCRLRSQCSVVAAQNCKRGNAGSRGSSYDCTSSVAVNSGLPTPLLSRFDLVVVFAEGGKGAASEKDKAEFILDACSAPAKPDQASYRATEPDDQTVGKTIDGLSLEHDKLREYIAFAKESSFSEPTDSRADQVISAYFCVLRKNASQGVGSGGVTVRTLQSLLRLAQAHARLMNHRSVKLEDAIAVIVLHRAALQDRVVGADSSVEGDSDYAPTMRDNEEEMPACEIQMRICNVALHHGSDIPDQSTYDFLETHVLTGLKLRKRADGSLAEDASLTALPAIPTPQQQPIPIRDAGSDTAASPGSQACAPSQPASQAPRAPRGRNLGCRLR